MSTPTESIFISDLELLLNTHAYGLPKWISGNKCVKLIELSKDVYKETKATKTLNSFSKICKILLNNLERKLTYSKPSYYIIKTFHFLYTFLCHLPGLTIHFITGKKSLYSRTITLLSTYYKRHDGACLFFENIASHSKAYTAASITYEFLKLSNFIVKQLLLQKADNENLFENEDKSVYSRFINNFSKIQFLKNLASFYSKHDFQYEKVNPIVKTEYKNEKYYNQVLEITSTSLYPPPPLYELRCLLFEFLEAAVNLTEFDKTVRNKRFWIINKPSCKIVDGSIRVLNKDMVKSKFKHAEGIFSLVELALKFIDADLLTIMCSSLRFFYGQYYLFLPSKIIENNGDTSCLSLGSRLDISPELGTEITYRLQSMALNILSGVNRPLGRTLTDNLVNLAWHYAGAADERDFTCPNIELHYCCGGAENGLECSGIIDFDAISALKVLSQSVEDFSISSPVPLKPHLVHIEVIPSETDEKPASLQDYVNYSVSTDFWIMNNQICSKYISPALKFSYSHDVTYPDPPEPVSKCNMFCIYNKHLYRNISWLHSNSASMPSAYRNQIVTDILGILVRSMANKGDVNQASKGQNGAKHLSNRNILLLNAIINIKQPTPQTILLAQLLRENNYIN